MAALPSDPTVLDAVVADDAPGPTWTMAASGVWTAWEATPRGLVAAGFVHRVGDQHLAVDALGAAIGAFDDRDVAQAAVQDAVTTTFAASIWMRER